jgi:nickel-dependent lactate racemase/phosphoglycerate dehydrogenase-like enzyme/transketolase C-terminal domain/subunit
MGDALLLKAATDSDIVFVSPSDLKNSVHFEQIGKTFGAFGPQSRQGRLVDLGIVEDYGAAVAIGLSAAGLGFKVVAASFDRFLSIMASQIEFATLNRIAVGWVGTHAGAETGEDGGGNFSIMTPALMSALSNFGRGMEMREPSDAVGTDLAVDTMLLNLQAGRSGYLRVSRNARLVRDRAAAVFNGEAGGAGYVVWKEPAAGRQPEIVLAGSGATVTHVIEAAGLLEAKGIPVRVIEITSLSDTADKSLTQTDLSRWLAPGVPVYAVYDGAQAVLYDGLTHAAQSTKAFVPVHTRGITNAGSAPSQRMMEANRFTAPFIAEDAEAILKHSADPGQPLPNGVFTRAGARVAFKNLGGIRGRDWWNGMEPARQELLRRFLGTKGTEPVNTIPFDHHKPKDHYGHAELTAEENMLLIANSMASYVDKYLIHPGYLLGRYVLEEKGAKTRRFMPLRDIAKLAPDEKEKMKFSRVSLHPKLPKDKLYVLKWEGEKTPNGDGENAIGKRPTNQGEELGITAADVAAVPQVVGLKFMTYVDSSNPAAFDPIVREVIVQSQVAHGAGLLFFPEDLPAKTAAGKSFEDAFDSEPDPAKEGKRRLTDEGKRQKAEWEAKNPLLFAEALDRLGVDYDAYKFTFPGDLKRMSLAAIRENLRRMARYTYGRFVMMLSGGDAATLVDKARMSSEELNFVGNFAGRGVWQKSFTSVPSPLAADPNAVVTPVQKKAIAAQIAQNLKEGDARHQWDALNTVKPRMPWWEYLGLTKAEAGIPEGSRAPKVAALDRMDLAQIRVPDLVVQDLSGRKSEQEIIDADPAIVLVRSSTQVTRDLIDRLPNLKAIIRLGHGLDNVDVAYARHKKIHVVGTKGSKRSVAALALRMTLIALQGDETAPADAAPAELLSLGSFEKALEFKLKGKPDAEDLRKAAAAILRPISARTLDQARWLKIGIIGGTGDIGSEAAALARSLGMDVLVNSRSLEENEGLRSKLKAGRFATQNEIYGTAHVVVLLTGLSDTTRGMVGREAVDAMIGNRELIALVNPDREDLVVESELVRLVDAGKKYLVDELPKLPALKAKSFYLPHIGGSTPEAEAGVFEATNRELASAAAALAGSRATVGFGRAEGLLTDREIRGVVRAAAAGENDFKDRRVLVITPDLTRSAAAKGLVGKVFGELYDAIGDEAEKVDILVAQGTHHALSAAQKAQLLGVTPRQLKHGRYKKVTIHDHRWNDPASLKTLGTLPAAFIRSATQGLFEADVPVTVNALVDRSRYDDVVVIGPVYPHEVVGISGGNKYFFPGVGGEELLNFFHWLGAVITNVRVIGNKETPVRAVVDEAAKLIDRTGVRRHAFTIVDRPEGIAGLWFGAPEAAWSEAADLAGAVHTATLDRPYRRVIAVLPEGLDELWVGGKGFYKAENVVADGGELVIYAPHITTLHPDFGPDIERIGYHSADYFLKQWDKFKNEKGAVLAHLTHVYGQGAYDPATGADKGRVKVTLATGIPPALAAKINLGYAEPDGIAAEIAPHLGGINPDHYVVAGDTLIIKPAGEKLFRLKPGITTAAGPAKGSRVQGQQGQAVTRGRFAGTALKVVVTKETDDEPATAGERVLARVDISRVGRHHEIYHTVTREAPLGLSARDAAFAIAAGIDEKARLGVHTGTVGKAELEAAVTATPLELSAGRETRPLAQGDTAPAAPGGPKAGARTGSVLVNFRVFVAGVIAVFAGRIAAAAAPVELPVALEAQRTAVVRLSAAEGRPGEAVFRVEPDAAIAPSYDLGLNDAKSAYRAALEAAAADAGSAAADSLLAARRALAAMEDEARQTQAGLPRELLLRPVPADFRVDLASYAALSADEAERQVRFLGLEALRFGRSAAGQDVRFVWQNAGSADSRARKAAEDMALLSRGRIVDEKDAASPEGRLQVRFLDPRAAVRSDGSVHIPWTGARAGEAPNWRVIFLLGKASAAVAAPHARRGAVDFEKLRSSDVPTALLDAWGSRAAARPTEAEFLGTVSGASPDLFVRFVLRPVQKIIDETLETLDAILKLIRSMA